MFTVEPPPELPSLIAHLQPSAVEAVVAETVDDYAPFLEISLREQSADSSGQNRFTEGWKAAPTLIRKGAGIIVQNLFDKARFVEFPTKPHLIVPVKAKTLSWVSAAGKRIFAGKVHHPGFGGHFVFETTMRGKLPQVLQALQGRIRGLFTSTLNPGETTTGGDNE